MASLWLFFPEVLGSTENRFFFFLISKKTLLKKRKALLSTQEVYTGTPS
jgi:hypothetical protein